uniref:NADH dehydrogenase subunit 2 n=1 Tax=Mimotettix multispinosus TaxID=2914181 RepID=UPI001EE0C635|nr:NADH dehydrogenase subunit 2 [Mimotettix multispinosus]UKE80365.1 NADH dehydrogenase subunit 2 [Mimotettix multispinosus]
MKTNSTKILLANTMMIGVIMTICSNNWISMWMGLELSLLSFIPFIQNKNSISSESMIKYFIMQSVASTMFLFSMVIMLIGVNMMNEIIMTISMLIKIGSAPFHNWVLMIIENLEYYVMFIMLTILKMPPMTIMFQINSKMLLIPIMLSMIMSSILCLNQSSIRKTLAYSSIYNMSLVLISINTFNISMTYLILYSLTMMLLISLLKNMKINFINQLMLNEFNNFMKINLWLNMLSMSGFPPLLGFLGKMLIMQVLIQKEQFVVLTMLLLTSMLVTMFYTRMAFTSMIPFSTSKKWSNYNKIPYYFLMTLNMMMIPLTISLTSIS